MKGAVAAGHPITADVGAQVLADGGNAVDACIAASAVSWVAESPLVGPGGGGFMLVHRARDGVSRVLDGFVAVPGAGLPRPPEREMRHVDITFQPGSATPYGVGGASVGVPGAIAVLADAHRTYGTRPWAELLRPAADLARRGVDVSPAQAAVHRLLDPVLRLSAAGREIYGADAPLGEGDRVTMADLGDTLDQLAEEGAEAFYGGELGRRIVEYVREEGGCLTEDDVAGYRVIRRSPVRAPYGDHEVVSNPPPSSGGVLVAFALRILAALGDGSAPGSAPAIRRVVAAMRETTRARAGGFSAQLHRGGLARRLLSDDAVEAAVERIRSGSRDALVEPLGLPSTTHVSVVDAAGMAASHSSSTGCGAGIVVPGTGIHLNNMLGEVDLNPYGTLSQPGRRLTSMMSPSLVLHRGRPRLVLGSAGSARLRGAIVQIVVNALEHGMALEEAIEAPRVHLEANLLHVEEPVAEEVVEELQADGYRVVRWAGRNVYFGGASVVAFRDDGGLEAAGDPRRGGAGVVVG